MSEEEDGGDSGGGPGSESRKTAQSKLPSKAPGAEVEAEESCGPGEIPRKELRALVDSAVEESWGRLRGLPGLERQVRRTSTRPTQPRRWDLYRPDREARPAPLYHPDGQEGESLYHPDNDESSTDDAPAQPLSPALSGQGAAQTSAGAPFSFLTHVLGQAEDVRLSYAVWPSDVDDRGPQLGPASDLCPDVPRLNVFPAPDHFSIDGRHFF